jgi:hypothetical protein
MFRLPARQVAVARGAGPQICSPILGLAVLTGGSDASVFVLVGWVGPALRRVRAGGA